MKKIFVFSLIFNLVFYFSIAAMPQEFIGSLKIYDKNNYKLNVWIDGIYKGKTPLVLDSLKVGDYEITLIEPSNLELLKENQIINFQSIGYPKDYIDIIKSQAKKKPAILEQLAYYSKQNAVVKNNIQTNVEFNINELLDEIKTDKKKTYIKYVIGGFFLVTVCTIVFVSIYFMSSGEEEE